MSETIDLYDAMLAELGQFGGVLAACIVVTPIADHGSLASHADPFVDACAHTSPAASGAGASEAIDEIGVALHPDLRSGVLAARPSLSGARAFHEGSFGGNVGSAGAPTMEHVTLTITGQFDWRQRGQSNNADVHSDVQYGIASNISDDILKMLSGCHFSTSRTCR